MKRLVGTVLIVVSALLGISCGKTDNVSKASSVAESQDAKEDLKNASEKVLSLIEHKEAELEDNELLKEISDLAAINAKLAYGLEHVFEYWDATESIGFVKEELEEDLPDDDSLCIVILGFKLLDDGSPEEELIERLKIGLEAANKYPNAHVLVTGGGTARLNKSVTEAGVMTDWLEENGLSKERIIIEDRSMTTVDNAIYSVNILGAQYPQVKSLLIVTSDYHVGLGSLLFEEKLALDYDMSDVNSPRVIGNVAYMKRYYRSFSREVCARFMKELYEKNIIE